MGSQLGGLGGGADPRLLGRLGEGRQHPDGGSEDRPLALRPLRGSLGGKDVTAWGLALGMGELSEALRGEEPCVLSDGAGRQTGPLRPEGPCPAGR